MKDFGSILMQLRNKKGLSQTQFAEKLTDLGYPVLTQAISKWEKNVTRPNVLQFFAICQILEVYNINETFDILCSDNAYYSLNEEGQQKVREYTNVLAASGLFAKHVAEIIPFKRNLRKFNLPVSAGTGQFLDSDDFEEVEVGKEVPEEADFGVTISGDSMQPQFLDGQTIWVQRQETLQSGEIGIFYLDGDSYCKKLVQTDDGLYLVSLNPKYEPIPVKQNSSFTVFGKVVG